MQQNEIDMLFIGLVAGSIIQSLVFAYFKGFFGAAMKDVSDWKRKRGGEN